MSQCRCYRQYTCCQHWMFGCPMLFSSALLLQQFFQLIEMFSPHLSFFLLHSSAIKMFFVVCCFPSGLKFPLLSVLFSLSLHHFVPFDSVDMRMRVPFSMLSLTSALSSEIYKSAFPLPLSLSLLQTILLRICCWTHIL